MGIFTPRTETVHIYGGDYHSRLAAKGRQVVEAAESVDSNGVARLGTKPEHIRLAEEYDALKAEAAEHRVDVTIQQLPRSVAKALRKAHPPIEDDDDEFAEALVVGGTVEVNGEPVEYRSVIDPEMSPEDFEGLSQGAFGVLFQAALNLNYGFATDPKEASLASLLSQASDET